MTSIKSRAVSGARSSKRARKSGGSSPMRAGLLGSTALVAVSLAATGAMAQTTVVPSPGDPAPGQTAIAGGTTLQLNNTSGSVNWLDGYVFTGTGTLETNTTGASSFALRSEMRMSAGGALNVNTGQFSGSSDGQGNWTNNLGSLNINAGAIFDGVEGAIFVDALTGSGRLAGGFAGARTTTIGVANGSGTFNGIITNTSNTGQTGWILALTHVGTGTQTLTGVNTYTGATTITGGTIALSGSGSISQSGSLSIGSSGTFDISGLAGGTTVNSLQGAGSVILGANTLTATGASSTFSGSITGSGGFTHTGANTLTLSGTNNWTGVTTVSQGVLAGTASSISGSSIVVNASGFGLQYSDVVAGTVTQNISGTGLVNIVSAAALTFAGDITTSGRLLVNHSGANVTLAGTRSGGTDYAVSAAGTFTVADTGQVLGGAYIGVSAVNPATVNNFGLVSTTGTSGTGVGLGSAMRFTNSSVVNNGSVTDAVASITGIENGVYTETPSSSTVGNYGSITGTNAFGVRSAGTGALNLTNYAGGTITGGAAGVFASGVLNLTNTGTITGNGATSSSGGVVASGGTITNNVGGAITGAYFGILNNANGLTVVNNGAITGSDAGIYTQGALTYSGAGSVLSQTQAGIATFAGGTINVGTGGSITGQTQGIYNNAGALGVTNAGSIRGVTNDGITSHGALTLTNTGTLSSSIYSGVAFVGGGSVTNSGTITGASDATYGYGVQNASGAGTTTLITNQSGGLINGGTGSILLNGAGNTTIDLQAGSTTTGQILSNAGGTHTVTIAGTLNGAYNAATGSGIDNITLASTGSISGAVTLGAGDDTFTWQGGTIGSTIDGGTGTADVFNSVLGTGVSGSLSLSNLSNFETYNHQSGTLTLTGSRTGGAVWTLAAGTILNVAGSLSNVGGTGFGITANGAATVNVLETGVLNNWVGVYFNSASTSTVANAGAITATSTGIATASGPVNVTNASTGTITSSAGDAIRLANGPSTITNSGVITGSTTGYGVYTSFGQTTVNNNAGTISGGAAGLRMGLVSGGSYGGLLTVTNAAGAQISGGTGIETVGTGALTLSNSGRVLGAATGAIVANGSGAVSITNNAGGQIVSSGGNAISTIGTATITNAGLIGNGTVSGGVYTASGTGYAISVAGGTITNSGTIRGASSGIYSSNGLTLTNTGTISGGQGGTSMWLDGVSSINAPSTILNAGTISAPVYSAVVVEGGTVTNAGGGTLTGGSDSIYGVAVQFIETGGTFTNYGSATGAGAGAVRVNTAGAATTINLHAGSTTGSILLNSGNDTVTIYNGRGSTGAATVDGASGLTLQAAGTLAAASFGAINMGGGTNTLTLRGAGDGTAANGAAGTMAMGSITGLTNLSKLDSGTWTLTGAGSYAGTTTVSGGTLRVLNTGNGLGNGAVSIATGATLNFDNQTGGVLAIKGDTFTGTGRILFTGDAGSLTALGNGGNGNVVISLSQGGLIDVQSGTVNGSGSGQGLWTNNMGGLNIASGARFDTVEGLVRVDALTGAGALSGGYGGTVAITVGVAGGTGTFSGTIGDNPDIGGRYLALTKIGAGTQTLTGTNTYTGQTSIEAGTLEVRNGSAIADTGVVSVSSGATFLVSNSETIGRLTGAGAVVLGTSNLTVGGVGASTFSGVISGSGGVRISGGGTQTLSGANTYTGATTASSATLRLGASNVLADTTDLEASSLGIIDMGAFNDTVRTATFYTGTRLDGTGTLTANSYISWGADFNANLGTGTFTALGGTTRLNGTLAGTYVAVNSGSILQLGGSNRLADTALVTVASGATLDLNAYNDTISRLELAGRLDGSGTLTAATTSLTGATVNANLGTGALFQQGGVTLLNGVAGATTVSINGGTLRLGSSDRLSDVANLYVNAGTILDIQGFSDRVGAVEITGGALNGTGLLTGGRFFLSGATINANLGTGNLSVEGSRGATILNGSSASTQVSVWDADSSHGIVAGNLVLGGSNRLADSAAVTVGTGGVLNLQGFNDTVGTLLLRGALNGTGTLTAGSYSLSNGTVNANLGTGLLINIGGTSTLNGTSAASTAWVQAGTLHLGASERLSDAAMLSVSSGATLDLQGYDETVGVAWLNGMLNSSVLLPSPLAGDAGDGPQAALLPTGTGTLTAAEYYLDGALINANLGAGSLFNTGGVSTLNGTSAAGIVTVQAGTLRLGQSDRLADTAMLSVSSGATLDLMGNDETVALAVINGTLNTNPLAVPAVTPPSGEATVAFSPAPVGTGTLTAIEYQLNGATVNANLGSGSLFNLGGVSTLNGTAAAEEVVVQAGTLRLGQSDRLADGATLRVWTDATLDLMGNDETVALAYLNGTLDSTVSLPSPDADPAQVIPALNVNAKGADGPLTIPVPTGTGTLTATQYVLNGATINANLGSGSLFNAGGTSTLNGTAAAGSVSVQAGTLALGASDRLADTAMVSVSTGATLDLNAFSDTVDLVLLNGTLDGTGTLTAAQYQLTGATVNANLGAGSLFNLGGGSTLTGAAAATSVSVQAGTLALGASDRLADTATVSVSSGATLDLNGFSDTVDLALLNGSLAGTGTLTAAQYQLTGATVNANLGAGSLFNIGGDSTLTGTAAAGSVSVQAGTLALGASDRLADTATVSVSSGATLNLNGFSDTVGLAVLNGSLAGTGTLTAAQYQLTGATVNANLGAGNLVNFGGTSTLNGTAAAGSVSLQAGTLSLGASNRLADTATVSVSAGATLNLNGFSDTVGLALLNGTLAGTGALTAAQYQLTGATVNANLGAGALINLGGTSVLTGTAAASQVNVNAGTLRLGASDRLADTAAVSVSTGATFDVNSRTDTIGALFGTGTVAIGAGRLTFGGVDSSFGGILTGTGSLVHTSGLFTLGGNHTLQTMTNTGGELRFLATTTGNVAVSGGSLSGAGTIGGALTVSNGATLSPGLAGQASGIGTLSAGSLTLNGGTLALDVLGSAGGNLIDRLVVSGTANLTGAIVAPTFRSPTSGYEFSTRYAFLTAGQRIGTFSNGAAFTESATGSGLFWRVRYDVNPNGAVLELRNLVNFDLGTNGSGNQNAVGRALTGGQLQASDDWAAVLSLLAGLNTSQRQAVFNSLSGEALADLNSALFAANDAFTGAVREAGASRNQGSAPLNFASAFSFVGGRDGAAAMVTGVLDAFDPSAEAGTGRGGWVSVQASDIDLEGKAGQADLNTRLNSFTGGYAVGTGNYVLGAAAGATRVEGDVIGRQSAFESDLLHAAGYARFDDGRWAADLTASAYGGEIDSRRMVTAGAFSGQALGRTHGEGQSLSASIARRFANDSGGTVSVGVMETMSRSTVDGFTETAGGGLSLEVAEQERNWQTTQLNLRVTQDYRPDGQPLRLYGGLGVLITTGDREALADMRFSGAAAGFGGFTIEGAQAAPLAGVTEFGLEYQPRKGVTLSTGYRAVFSDRLHDNQIGARMSVQW
ncbi:autotransporter-associated beta strand repeat-containing protein [uncultured Brevundimonas sp.]|uniref:autotransporter-associated beta strand repeat-containing protein n=1 Tax=uncultured Brevundimonas sp. TaxID=213418 RepID=UPI0030EC4C3B